MVFEWDPRKDRLNQLKHGVAFTEAQQAFDDPHRVILEDSKHSTRSEQRFFCLGRVVNRVLTVRFTYRSGKIRVIGAGAWREGRERYVKENRLR